MSASWDGDPQTVGIGSTFTGNNSNQHIGEWSVQCTIDDYQKNRIFGWCTGDPAYPGARWRLELDNLGSTTRIRHKVLLGPGSSGLTRLIEQQPEKEDRIIANRLKSIETNMRRVVDGMKDSLES